MEKETIVAPELLRVQEVAKLCGLGVRTVFRDADRGVMPRPVKIGGAVRWRRAEILEWVRNGCPRVRGASR